MMLNYFDGRKYMGMSFVCQYTFLAFRRKIGKYARLKIFTPRPEDTDTVFGPWNPITISVKRLNKTQQIKKPSPGSETRTKAFK